MFYILDEEKRPYKSVAANLLHAAGWSAGAVFSGIGVGMAVSGTGTPGGGLIYFVLMAITLFVAIRALRMEVRVVDGKIIACNLFSTRPSRLKRSRSSTQWVTTRLSSG